MNRKSMALPSILNSSGNLKTLTSAGLFDIEKENYQSILFGPISGGWCETGKCDRMGRCPKSGIPCATVDSLENRALGLTCKDFHCPNGYALDGYLGYCVPKPDPFYN